MVGLRKRAAENEIEHHEERPENIDEELNDEEEIPQDSSSEEEDELPAPQPVARPAAAQRQRKRRVPDALPQMAGDTTLIAAVRSPTTAITIAAKDWIERYRSDRAEATAEVLTFLLQAAGITSKVITPEDVEHAGADEIKQSADQIAQEEGLEEILGSKTARHLKANYRELWDKIIRESAAAGLLQGGFFLDKAVNLVIALNTSIIREFRRIAAITASQIASSLLHVIAALSETRDTAAAQATAEESKKQKGKNAAADRAAAFNRQVANASSAIRELLAYVDSIFQSVFANRFRDVDGDIRAIIVDGIGRWMILLPSTFLSSTYLKYIAWALSDKDPGVRLAAASALLALYSDPSNASQLRDFSDRFSNTFKELMNDKEDAVAVAGVRLVTLLVQLEHFSPAVGSLVFRLMSDASLPLRSAAADLAAGMLAARGRDALDAYHQRTNEVGGGGGGNAHGKRGKRDGAAANARAPEYNDDELELAGVLCVLRMLAAEEQQQEEGRGGPETADALTITTTVTTAPPLGETAIALVVSALAERSSSLANWQLMVDWLRTDFASKVFGDASTSDLAHTLLVALRCATGGKGKVAGGTKGASSRGIGAKEKRAAAQNSARQNATLVLQKEAHPLIKKFQADASLISPIVSLIPELQLEVYSLRRQEKSLTTLLQAVKDVFFMHDDAVVPRACADALVCCARSGPDTTRDAARAVLNACVHRCSDDLGKAADGIESMASRVLSQACQTYRTSQGGEEHRAFFNARRAVCRAEALAEVHPGGVAENDAASNACSRILELAAGGADLPTPIVYDASRTLLLLLVYNLSILDRDAPDPIALGKLAASQSALSGQIEAVLTTATSHTNEETRHAAAAVQADLMTLFSSKALSEHLQEAAYAPSDDAVNAFWEGMESLIIQPTTPSKDDSMPPTNRILADTMHPPPAHVIARIISCASVPQYRQLAAQLLSYWENRRSPAHMTEIVKSIVKRLKSSDNEYLPALYLEAMKICFLRCKAEERELENARNSREERDGDGNEEEELEKDDDPMNDFLHLSHKLASSQAAFNAPPTTMAYIAEHGALWALEELSNADTMNGTIGGSGNGLGGGDGIDWPLEFLHGLSYFMVRVRGNAAAAVAAAVEVAGQRHGAPSEEDEETDIGNWALFYEYCDALKSQAAAAAAPATAIKRAGGAAGAAAAAGGPGRGGGGRSKGKGGRKISFALGEDGPEDSIPTSSLRRTKQRAERAQRASQRAAAGKPSTKAAVGVVVEEEQQQDDDIDEDVDIDIAHANEDSTSKGRKGRKGGVVEVSNQQPRRRR